ncbi:hypothetical protein AOLI_G00187310 [Acnodon oligacanthus]
MHHPLTAAASEQEPTERRTRTRTRATRLSLRAASQRQLTWRCPAAAWLTLPSSAQCDPGVISPDQGGTRRRAVERRDRGPLPPNPFIARAAFVLWLYALWLLPFVSAENRSEGSSFNFTLPLEKVNGQVHVNIRFPDGSYVEKASNGEMTELGESYKHRAHLDLTTEHFSLTLDHLRENDSGMYSFSFWHGAEVMEPLQTETVSLFVQPKEPQSTDAGSSEEQQGKEQLGDIVWILVPLPLVLLFISGIIVRMVKRRTKKKSIQAGSSAEEHAPLSFRI